MNGGVAQSAEQSAHIRYVGGSSPSTAILLFKMLIIYPKFKKFVKDNNLISNEDVIILAFSGGKDSVTLFSLLKELQKDISFNLSLAYFNHKIRNDYSIEEEWVENFAIRNKIKLYKGNAPVKEISQKTKKNLEETASRLRYNFFDSLLAINKINKIATAHSMSDQSETFIIKLLRGSGLRGLSSIYKKKQKYIRPLLNISTDEIFDFIQRNKIKYYEDSSNKELSFLRNKIRHTVSPQLKNIDKNYQDRIFNTIENIQVDYDFLLSLSQKLLKKASPYPKILRKDILLNLHPAIQNYIIREFIKEIKGNLLSISSQHCFEIIKKLKDGAKGYALPGLELKFHKNFIFNKKQEYNSYNYIIDKNTTELYLKEVDLKVKITLHSQYKDSEMNDNNIFIDLNKIDLPLNIRNASKKDYYQKKNSPLNLKVFEVIRELGFPYELRNLVPLICSKEEVIWCKGAIKRYELNKESTKLLKISFENNNLHLNEKIIEFLK